MDVTLTCNGCDLSPFLSRYSLTYETAYDKTVKALDGTEYSGNMTSRPIITFSLRPMTDVQAQQCYNALTAASPVLCVYTDEAINANRSAQMRLVTNLDFLFVLRSTDGHRYYSGGEITLRGVKCLA